MDPLPAPLPPAARRQRRRRLLLWGVLVASIAVAQSLLVWLTLAYESSRAQEQVESAAQSIASELKLVLVRHQQSLQALLWNDPPLPQWHTDAAVLLHGRRELLRVERRDAALHVVDAVDSPFQAPMFTRFPRAALEVETQIGCQAAQRQDAPTFSRSYFVPLSDGLGMEVIDLCTPVGGGGGIHGFMVATISLARLLDSAAASPAARGLEISFVEGGGTRLARAGGGRGAGVFVAESTVDVPGQRLQLRADSSAGSPRLIPNLSVALVLGLSLVLAVVVVLLARDVRRRAGAEAALAEALAYRKAMEDSLVTGLRARDLDGRITHVNPAFCQMVGFDASELVGSTTPPYWPPEMVATYAARQTVRLAEAPDPQPSREGFETLFMRRDGERFAVLIFEAPLVDGSGRHTGWMSAVLDVSAQRRVEELSRQQQERLQATARLATVGEMASLLSHELNQPLAAIASYAAGSLNLLREGATDPDTMAMLQQAAQRVAEQAERAGRVIKSVNDFVRRREQAREAVRADVLFEAVLPLVRLQARKSGARIEIEMPSPPPRAMCDRTMVEQVLLNLTRNGIQAMEALGSVADRRLLMRVRQVHPQWVEFSVVDAGGGIAPEVAQRLFTPFFTTRSEGMGLGLSLCRTVVEQHGGALDFVNLANGTEFRFTLPAAPASRPTRETLADAPAATAP